MAFSFFDLSNSVWDLFLPWRAAALKPREEWEGLSAAATRAPLSRNPHALGLEPRFKPAKYTSRYRLCHAIT